MRRLLGLALPFLFSAFAAGGSCSVSAPSAIFGNYSGVVVAPGGVNLSVTCTSGLAYDVDSDAGQHSGGTFYNFEMSSSGVLLHYDMYTNSARTQQWGGTPGYDSVHGTGNGSAQSITIYPTIFGGQYLAPGTYNDIINVSVHSTAPLATTTLSVTATILASCAITANSLAFGNYTGSKVDAATTLAVTCTNTTTYQIGADNGQHGQFIGVWAKYMIGPSSNKLRYHLYPDAARSIEWGTTAGTNEVAGTGTGVAQTIPVYGTIGAGSYGSGPGSYSDTVTLTITY